METLDVKQRFIELRAKGWSFDKIAKELGKAKQTLLDWSKDLDLEIAQAKAIELETIYESYSLYKEARLKMIGGILSKIKEELDQRDLSDVPTDKLLDLLLTYEGVLKEMIVEPIFLSSKEMVEEREERNLLENQSTITAEGETLLKVG